MKNLGVLVVLATLPSLNAPAQAQADPAQPDAAQPSQAAAFTPEQLEQIVAPVALYPDALLTQILMASTYPIEVVQADRWVKSEPRSQEQSKATAGALEEKSWDPSVKSLVGFPNVLDMMSKDLDWLTKLGDAFIGQQAEVLQAVQRLRAKAKAEGNLEDSEHQKVEVKNEGASQVIVIESSDPDVIYVPTYDPVVVYGTWPYPSYPPYYYYPPNYSPGYPGLAFGAGLTLGLAWGYAWGNCDWGHNDIDIDIDRNINRNTNIDRDAARARLENRTGTAQTWRHDPSHRRGVSYRDPATAQRLKTTASRDAAQARQSYRGRAEAGRSDLSNMTPDQRRAAGNRTTGAADRARSAPPSSAFGGIDRGGNATRQISSRGHASRSGGASRSRGGGGGRRR